MIREYLYVRVWFSDCFVGIKWDKNRQLSRNLSEIFENSRRIDVWIILARTCTQSLTLDVNESRSLPWDSENS